jgi:Fe-S cluster assembly protein SufB
MSTPATSIEALANQEYKWGFVTEIEADTIPKGLSEHVIGMISAKKNEPGFMLEWRLKSYRQWLTMEEPTWSTVRYPAIDYQDIAYYSAPKTKIDQLQSLDEVDPELLRTYAKLGIPLREQELFAGVAVDAVFDRVSVATTFKGKLAEMGIIFCSFSEAVQEHPELVQKYLGSVVPHSDNFFAALNSAVVSDGSFVYIPPGVRCPMELSTYFRINAKDTGQFERTLIIADAGAYVSYLEGCTAPMRDKNQLHAAVVELVALDSAQIKYSTLQNWYPGDKEGKGGIYNFVTKRGKCLGVNSKVSWTQVETGSAITWKYPSVLLMGDNSVGEFYSVALANNYQQADTGTKMIHIGNSPRGLYEVTGRLLYRTRGQSSKLRLARRCRAGGSRSSQYDQRPLSGDHPRPQQKATKLPVARRCESESRRLQPAVRGSVQDLSEGTRRRDRQGDVPWSRVRNFDRLGVFDDRGLEGQNRWRGRDSAGEVPRTPDHRSTIAEGPRQAGGVLWCSGVSGSCEMRDAGLAYVARGAAGRRRGGIHGMTSSELRQQVIQVFRTIYDPEMPVNIYELGLIYEVNMDETRFVSIRMTLTAPNCPVAGTLPPEVEAKVRGVHGVSGVKPDLVFDPPWTKNMMSEAAKLQLGIEDVIAIARIHR